MKNLLIASALLMLFSGPAFGANRQYVIRAIDCEEQNERYVDDAYICHLQLLSGKTIPEGTLKLPSTLVERRDSFVVFERAFYVTPNSLRGFSLALPRSLMIEKDGILTNVSAIRAVKENWKQGIVLIECGAN